MQEGYKRIGISGGTFDPIHYGHLIAAEEIREKFNLGKVLFIPSGMPPHKPVSEVTGIKHRFNMVRDAIKTNPYFDISCMEIDRTGYTYTVDTLARLKGIYGEDTKLFFIIGADIILDLPTWKEYEKVFATCEFIAAFRPGYDKDILIKEIEHLKTKYKAKIHLADNSLIGISSTGIRERVGGNKSIKYLVPENIEAYIYENGLYKSG